MDYELAKQLKDAGFPQEGTIVFASRGDTDLFITEHSKMLQLDDKGKWKDMPYVPTLSELIGVIGKVRFISLESCIPNELCEWRATGWDERPTQVSQTGETPEEAVANLWLALQTK